MHFRSFSFYIDAPFIVLEAHSSLVFLFLSFFVLFFQITRVFTSFYSLSMIFMCQVCDHCMYACVYDKKFYFVFLCLSSIHINRFCRSFLLLSIQCRFHLFLNILHTLWFIKCLCGTFFCCDANVCSLSRRVDVVVVVFFIISFVF